MNKANIFKAYDIRGIYPQDINEDIAFKIGAALYKFLKRKLRKENLKIVVGRDCRLSSDSLFKAFCQGVVSQKGKIIDIGLVSTDTLYFALAYFKYDGGVMVTASHNPKQYNGFKMLFKGCRFISQDWGMAEMKKLVEKQSLCKFKINIKNNIIRKNIIPDYIKYILKQIDLKNIKPLKVVVDAGNGMGGKVIEELIKKLPIKLYPLYFQPDGYFPNRSPDPGAKDNIKICQKKIIKYKADFGLAFDEDGDRTIFVNEKGEVISGNFSLALFTKYFLEKYSKQNIVYDLICSRIVPETIKKYKGKAIKSKTGRPFIRKISLQTKAIFGGEFSGHLFFRDVFYNECGGLALLIMIKILSQTNQPLSQLIKEFKKYTQVKADIEIKEKNKDKVFQKISQFYQKGKKNYLDGLTVEFSDYWFNVRASNTEPLLRITIEAKDKKLASDKLEQIKKIIKSA